MKLWFHRLHRRVGYPRTHPFDSLEKISRTLRNQEGTEYIKLQLATSVALGVAHVHEIDDSAVSLVPRLANQLAQECTVCLHC